VSDQEWKSWKPPRGNKKTAEEVLKYDYNKARSLYKNRGFLTYYIWQKTEKENIEEILCLLKTMIMKS
jgi:outer membrane protein assembly factor BamA